MSKNEGIFIGYKAIRIIKKDSKKKGDLLIFGVEGSIGNVFTITG